MLGYDISWAAFNIIEVMSASKFTFKVRQMSLLWDLNPVMTGRRAQGCPLAGGEMWDTSLSVVVLINSIYMMFFFQL